MTYDNPDTLQIATGGTSSRSTTARNVSGFYVGKSNVYSFSTTSFSTFEVNRSSGSRSFKSLSREVSEVHATLWIENSGYGRSSGW
jgi:hypothetical protein